MIPADTCIRVDYLRSGDDVLVELLDEGLILGHPWIVAEISLGSLRHRDTVLSLLDGLPHAPFATIDELRHLIGRRVLSGLGVGLIDVGLIAACLPAPGCRLWTRDKHLARVADEMAVSFSPER